MSTLDRWERLGGPLAYAYAAVLVALFLGLAVHVSAASWWDSVHRTELLQAVALTLLTSLGSTTLAMLLATPIAWRLARRGVPGQAVLDVLLDLPLSLSPLVLGLAFLLFFATAPGRAIEQVAMACGLPLRGAPAGVVLGQTVIATAFAIRHLRGAFAGGGPEIPTLGAALHVRRTPLLVAATITWARTIGEFGPLLLFVGIVPGHSEVLSTAIYLSWASGDLQGAAAAAILMVLLSFVVVLAARRLGQVRTRPQEAARKTSLDR